MTSSTAGLVGSKSTVLLKHDRTICYRQIFSQSLFLYILSTSQSFLFVIHTQFQLSIFVVLHFHPVSACTCARLFLRPELMQFITTNMLNLVQIQSP